jgi:hypothetical protein
MAGAAKLTAGKFTPIELNTEPARLAAASRLTAESEDERGQDDRPPSSDGKQINLLHEGHASASRYSQ